jgi:SAM-dependent methyltransferase
MQGRTHDRTVHPATGAVRPRAGCNVCGGTLESGLADATDPLSGDRFAVLVCRSCGLGHTDPQPDDLSQYYGPSYHGGRHGPTALYCALRRALRVRRAAGAARGRRLLDVGCGDGTFLEMARKFGWRVSGTELNPTLARAAGFEAFETLDGARAAGPYACITLWHSLEHLADPRGAMGQLVAMLEPGGTIVAAVPNRGGWQACAFGRSWFHLDVPRHLFHFTPGSLARLFEVSGLSVARRWDHEVEYDVFGWCQSMLNAFSNAPNRLFDTLTHRRAGRGSAASWIVASALCVAALPAVGLASLARCGSTIVMAARGAPEAKQMLASIGPVGTP